MHTVRFDRCVKEVGKTARNPYAVCSAELGERRAVLKGHRRKSNHRRRRRRMNPRENYIITAQRAGGRPLRFVGQKFAARGKAVKFPTRGLADDFARHLSSAFPQLKRYTLSVVRA